MDTCEITIPNWAKFNPRADRVNFTWFRLQNEFFHDQRIFPLTDAEKVLFLFFICEASKKNSASLSIRLDYATAILKKKKVEIQKGIAGLARSGLIVMVSVAESRQNDGKEPSLLRPTNETNEQDERDGHECNSSADALPPLAKLWNEHCGPLPKVRAVSGTRSKQAEARWRETPNPTHWAEVVQRIVQSPFCRGQNDRGWRADFDFLLKPETHNRVLEGKYDDSSKRPPIQRDLSHLRDLS